MSNNKAMHQSVEKKGQILFATLSFAQEFEEAFRGIDGVLRITWQQYDCEDVDAIVERIKKETPMREGLHFEVVA